MTNLAEAVRQLILKLRRRTLSNPVGVDAEEPALDASPPDDGCAAATALQELVKAGERTRIHPGDVLSLLKSFQQAGNGRPSPTPQRVARVRNLARRLVRQNQHALAKKLLETVISSWSPPLTSGLYALRTHANVSLGDPPGPGLEVEARAALEGADEAYALGDLETAAELVTIGAGLLLHRDLHADTPTSPLVEDPHFFLAPFRGSTAMRALAAPPRRTNAEGRPGEFSGQQTVARSHGPLHITVLTGAYPRFAAPLVAALRAADHEVTVLGSDEGHPPFRWLGTDPEQVFLRLKAAVGTDGQDPARLYGVPSSFLAAVREADVVVADWCDKGAVWASLACEPGTRLVIRIHGMDALSLWPHAMNWSAVDALISVSQHQARAVDRILAEGAAKQAARTVPSCQVVPNLVPMGPLDESPPRESRTLGLVGWGKKVKDPLWAVEVLAELLRRDPAGGWRLRLIGPDFQPGEVSSSQDYADRFRERIARPDVAAAMDLVGHSDEVPREVRRLGFILSSSVRESFHQGLVEGVFGAAVPVVRDWPFFASLSGASTLFPEEWVATDVRAAVDRIWALRDEEDRTVAAELARAQALALFGPVQTATKLVEVVTGRTSAS